MPKRVPPLTETHCERCRYKPGGKNRHFDGGGLYLEVTPVGSKLWRLKYRHGGAEKLLALGQYPDVTATAARKARTEARELLAQGIDPSAKRKADRQGAALAAANTFEAVAREWFAKRQPGWVPAYSEKIIARLQNDVFPYIGAMPIANIEAPQVLNVLDRIAKRGALETAGRVRTCMSEIFEYAISTARAKHDPAHTVRKSLATPEARHFPTLTDPDEIGALLRAIDGFRGTHVTRCALLLAPLVFVRPGELRMAEWGEIDLGAAEWRIPAARMKQGRAAKLKSRPHLVPLSRQALAVLADLQPLTGHGRLVFPGVRDRNRPMSENTVNAALRALGFDGSRIVGHGFRHMASTLLNERGYSPDAIERQLAHKAQGVRAVYNRAEHLPERRRMMQDWADYLDALRAKLPADA